MSFAVDTPPPGRRRPPQPIGACSPRHSWPGTWPPGTTLPPGPRSPRPSGRRTDRACDLAARLLLARAHTRPHARSSAAAPDCSCSWPSPSAPSAPAPRPRGQAFPA
eukprot:8586783-Heterocapsa_arctica.AAC.1